jgi:hypothetical protein
MDASRYFFQQLSGRFFRIALLSSFLITAITLLLVLRNNQVTLLAGKELPSLTQQNEQQQQIITTYLALDDLAKLKNADNLAQDYELVQQQINKISLLNNNHKSQLDLMFVGHKEFFGVIDKLSKNNDRNNQLKQSTIIQLQLINDQLTSDIKEKKRQSSLLLQQISLDKFTDKVTANRSKAYAIQISELSQSQQLQQTIIRALLAFRQLDLQSSILEFDDVSEELKQVLTSLFPNGKLVYKRSSLLLTAQLMTLNQLLFSQQNSVAKWRSHLRLSRLYIEFIEQQQQKLQQLVLKISTVKPLLLDEKMFLLDWVPDEVNDLLDKQNITISNLHLQFTVLGFIGLLFLFLLGMIFGTKKRIKLHGQDSVQLFTQFIESMSKNSGDKLSPEMFNSIENKKIAEQFQKTLEIITNPEHSEKEYQLQLEEQKMANSNISQQVEDIKKLKTHIEKLEQAARNENLKQVSKDSADNRKLSNMVVRAMLQSQSFSIGSGVTSLQVYRQLARIFDWCRQNKIRGEFLSTVQSMTLSDVALHHEIDAALLNIITDAHFQRNKIYYQQDQQLLTHAKLDIRLFHRLVSGVCRLLLTDLFKANLQITSSVIDINEGQQIVRFDFSVTTNKTIAKVPEEIERLLLVERPTSAKMISNDTLEYLCLLFDSLNVTDKNVQLKDNGYQFSFTLPIAFADVTPELSSGKIDFKQANIILLSDDNNIRTSIEKAISSANGFIESLAKPELVIQQLCTAHLNEKKVDVVILGSDFYSKSLEKIQQHIASLAKGIQPRLFVMQPFFNALLERHGLFEQTANPLKKIELQQSISDFLATDKTSNSRLNASEFTAHQHLVTQVEVLFAVENPAEHLTLLRILQWLGLQVKVVCQPKAMIKFWSSGRYLLLFTEFGQTPFIEMAASKDVRRDIFTFNQSDFTRSDVQTLASKWTVSIVPELNNIDALVTLLKPWLKAKETKVVSIDKSDVQPKEVTGSNRREVNTQTNDFYESFNSEVQANDITEDLDKISLELGFAQTTKTTHLDPLNLEVYAQHQGSAELAVEMLDDYIIEINEGIENLSKAIEVQDYQLSISLTNSLIKTGTILAAQEFSDICLQLLNALRQDATTEPQNIIMLFDKLSHQKLLLNKFAEAM